MSSDLRSPRLPPTPNPSPTRGEGGRERGNCGAEPDRWYVPWELKQRMKEAARELRKQPTESEAKLWEAIRGGRLGGRKFRRQQAVGTFVVDFYCSDERLVVEVDGGVHETQQEKDALRQEALESLGLRFVRISDELVMRDLEGALATIRRAFRTSPHHHPSPLVGEGPGVGGSPPHAPVPGRRSDLQQFVGEVAR